MPHVIERATTGRAKCRGCGATIAKDTLRIGEPVPNLYADKDGAESLHWHHPACAAYRRPEAFLQAVAGSDLTLPDRDALVAVAAEGVAHHRLPRIGGAQRAPSGRAACRACRAPIAKDAWRIALLFWQDGRRAARNPAIGQRLFTARCGFHVPCARRRTEGCWPIPGLPLARHSPRGSRMRPWAVFGPRPG